MKFNKIVVLDKINILESAMKKLENYSDNPIKIFEDDPRSIEDVKERINDADCVLLSWRTKIDKEVIEYCKNLKYICLCCTSLGNIDLEECRKRNIVISNVVDYGDEGVVEYIFFELLNLSPKSQAGSAYTIWYFV